MSGAKTDLEPVQIEGFDSCHFRRYYVADTLQTSDGVVHSLAPIAGNANDAPDSAPIRCCDAPKHRISGVCERGYGALSQS